MDEKWEDIELYKFKGLANEFFYRSAFILLDVRQMERRKDKNSNHHESYTTITSTKRNQYLRG